MTDNESVSKWSKREWLMVIAVLMLVQFIVQASAFVYCTSRSALNYWSLVGTSISIILALVAIIWTFFQNLVQQKGSESIAAQIERLQSLVGEAYKSGGQFKSELDRLDEVRSSLQESVDLARQSREQIVVVGKTVEESKRILQEMSSKPSETKAAVSHQDSAQHRDFPNLLRNTSALGMFALYGCYLSWKKSHPFDIKNWPAGGTNMTKDYIYGFIIGIHSTDVLTVSMAGTICTVKQFPDSLTHDLKQNIHHAIDAAAKRGANLNLKSQYDADFEAIEAFFGGPA